MLPILRKLKELKNSQQTGVIVKNRQSDSNAVSDPIAAIEPCMVHLLVAIAEKDPKSMAEAVYDAFCILDSEPHEEGEHVNPHSYDAQNKLGEK